MKSREWLAYLGQQASEQMASLCQLYGEGEDERGESLSIPTVLSLLVLEGVQPEIVAHYFRKKLHTARVVQYNHFQLIMVSKEVVPVELLRKTKRLNKELFVLKQQEVIDLEKKADLEEELDAAISQLHALPVHVQLWPPMTAADDGDE